jgi:hypothetical protein
LPPNGRLASNYGLVRELSIPNLSILQVRTMQEHLETMISQETLVSRLSAIFAALAVLLAAIGLYGVMSFNVVRRSNEIGIRIAPGATCGSVQWMVLRESLALLAVETSGNAQMVTDGQLVTRPKPQDSADGQWIHACAVDASTNKTCGDDSR